MIRINLLPVREARRRADLQQQGLVLVVLVAASLAITGWWHMALRSRVAAAHERVAQIQAQIKQFEPQLKQVDAYKKKKAEVQKKLDVIAGLERSRSGPVHMMDELATRTPERMWLTSLQASGAGPRGPGVG
jgi:type IV pilus assembly protein PilN